MDLAGDAAVAELGGGQRRDRRPRQPAVAGWQPVDAQPDAQEQDARPLGVAAVDGHEGRRHRVLGAPRGAVVQAAPHPGDDQAQVGVDVGLADIEVVDVQEPAVAG